MFTVGIPRAMSYYYLYPLFKTLLVELGGKVILSRPTTKKILEKMEICPTDEPCIAVKLYFPHVQQLLDENCQYILLPKLISVDKDNFCCPKMIGMADMIINTLPVQERALFLRIDMNNKKEMTADLKALGERLGVSKGKLKTAWEKAWKVQEEYIGRMVGEQLTMEEAYRLFDQQEQYKAQKKSIYPKGQEAIVGVIGHPYVLYEWISHDLVTRFQEYGRVITPEMVSREQVQKEMSAIYEGNRLWSYEAQMLGSALYLMKNKLVDRLVLVGLFECGPQSIIEAYIEEAAEKGGIPLLKLFLDEQTGEAGLTTRIEAFMDTTGEIREKDEITSIVEPKITQSFKPLFFEKPVIGFPSMGNLDSVIYSILDICGVERIKTPPISRRSIERGKELAPEFVCLPLTATLGQMIEMMEMGANSFLMVTGKGRCRLGWYGQIQELLLKRNQYDFNMLVIDSPFPLNKNATSFLQTMKKVTGGARWHTIVKSLVFGYRKLQMIEEAERICRKTRAYEVIRGEGDQVFNWFKNRIENCCEDKTLRQIYREFQERMLAIQMMETNPLKVWMVGEIWVLLESFVNMDIERLLGSHSHIRVLVERELSVGHWLDANIIRTRHMKERNIQIKRAAKPYLQEYVGGHGRESVGLSLLAAKEGADGVIHLMPFTCMPEIVAQNILTQVSARENLPVLSFIISDQTGEAGFETRVEAFLELLLERRFEKENKGGGQSVLLHRH